MKAVDYIRKGWTREANARNRNGKPCLANSAQAVRWCAIGALHAAYPNYKEFREAKEKVRRVLELSSHWSLTAWNDVRARTKHAVIEAMEKAGV